MQSLLEVLIGNGVIAAAIAAAALLALLCRRPALAHVLWVLVLIKLVTPPIVRLPVQSPWAAPTVVGTEVAVPPAELSDETAGEPVLTAAAPVVEARATKTLEGKPNTVWTWSAAHAGELLLLGWLTGSAWYVLRAIVRTRRLGRLLEACDAPADARLVAHVRDVADRIGLSDPPAVHAVSAAVSPMVIGAGRSSKLILPASLVARLAGDELRAVLAHELAHLRRRDHWVRWLEAGATALLWWHPLLWLARRGLHEAEEQCCDAWVVWAMPDSRRAYADALVTTAGLLAGAPDAPLAPGASGLGQFQQLKRRLVMIMNRQTSPALSSGGKWLLAAGMLLALPVLPALVNDEALDPVSTAVAAAPQEKDSDDSAKDDAKTEPAPAEDKSTAQASRQQIDAEKAKARARARLDGRKYSEDELVEAEALYQVANKNWRSPEAKESLKKMVEKYPKFNRTGCAILYLGQKSEGEEREKYYKQAVEQFGDCYYFNGVQVGPMARYWLGHHYIDKGEKEKGVALLKEVVTKFPNSVTHQGDRLAQIAKEDLESINSGGAKESGKAK